MSNRRLSPNQSKPNRRQLTNRARTIIAAILLSGGVLSPGMMAWANSPAPGTIIRNQATGSFVDPSDSSTQTIISNEVQVEVAEVAGITVVSNGYNEPTDGTVNEGDTVYVDFVITNVGNDPTQFVLPGSASVTNGTQAGNIQIIEYDADGTGAGIAVDLTGNNVTVPGGGDTTGNLLSGVVSANNGSIPAGGSITVRVPVTAGTAGLDLTVNLGDTAATDGQNETYVTGTNDVYTQDNSGTDNGDTAGAPINNEREAENSLTVAISSASVEYSISGQVRNDTDNDGDLNDADSGISGVTVALYDDPEGDGDPTGSTELTTTTTDGSGNYSFTDLAPGNYIVIETDPNGYTSTNDSDSFNNNRIAVNLTNADVTGNDFLDSNTPLPSPPPLSCALSSTYDFTWGAGGAVWNIDDTFNTYTNVAGSGVDVTLELLDPSNQNIDTGNLGASAIYTRTDGAYGLGYLTWAMTAQNSNQEVSFVFTFSKPIVIDDFQIIDVDGTGYGAGGGVPEPGGSFQDEIAASASLNGSDVPISVQPETAGTMTITGQTAKGSYRPGINDNLSHLDSRGHMVMATSAAVNSLRLDYSNGPDDANPVPNGDGTGISDDHAIAIDQVFRFCTAPTQTISGQVREDIDNDGDLNDADSGIDTVTVQLFTDPNGDGDPSDGTLVDTQITNGSGNFSFTNVDAGDYIIVETNSAGFDSTADSAGDNDDRIPVSVTNTDSTGHIFLDTAMPIVSDPDVLLVKRITALNNDTNTTNGHNLAIYIDQDDIVYPYDDNTIPPVSDPNNPAYDENNPAFDPRETNQWPTPLNTSLRGGIDGGDVMPNDEIEYTIYFLSSGNTTAESVLFCDYVPTFTTFIPNAYTGNSPQATGGIGGADLSIELYRNGTTDYHTGANDGDSATYFAPGVDPANSFPDIDCDGDGNGSNANPNGAVVVNLGDLPDATTDATGAYGHVKFRARVK
ncbi:beta strand repeat-containing protein [Leptolyngbya sp. Heron Island J]|uniref:beta strand repeat-containing protein n=1 Tax=Leptolyngbya sp. Heron Island J TaxID=1385935 RepID=UPI001377AE25|nr:SdrD B-like domain-containing protein [Leptolyngbya sp. Heron Island J]